MQFPCSKSPVGLIRVFPFPVTLMPWDSFELEMVFLPFIVTVEGPEDLSLVTTTRLMDLLPVIVVPEMVAWELSHTVTPM